ncbi:helix-turn-helix domain-containing protein [Xinfangfangia pollutisoli]|uniref:helix-turn-helix domain-containing protein n=1 Tax=Xinfangfangia pollutisoli TaxID=2865960 RepID=UPI001CD6A5D2|nr:helix-turn-helix domain-containing protein [Xinfangfangia pollutisoli]
MKSRGTLPQIDMHGVAFRLEALRSTTGLTKDAFAKSAGIDPSSYTKVTNYLEPGKEDRTKILKSEHAFAISERWGVTMDFIYRGDLSKISDALRTKIIATLNSGDR